MDSLKKSMILLTGSAGFLGYHLTKTLLRQGYNIIGVDNINDYYDPELKYDRLSELGIKKKDIKWRKPIRSNIYKDFQFIRIDLKDQNDLKQVFNNWSIDFVFHLAAQAGVRHSIRFPEVYIESNIVGFLNILECCRHNSVKHLFYASSSSVYGESVDIPFSESDRVDHPVSLYAATKKSNELMAHAYSHLYNISCTGLRFFTVYGPWGRPDMAYFLFTKAAAEGRPIKVFNRGQMKRDFTYIDDLIKSLILLFESVLVSKSGASGIDETPRHEILNIGNGQPENLGDFIAIIEKEMEVVIKKEMLPMQAGDMIITFANTSQLVSRIGYSPNTPLEEGIKNFVSWYKAKLIK